MSYEVQNFANGEILTAEQLNHIEEGIVELEETELNSIVSVEQSVSSSTSGGENIWTLTTGSGETFEISVCNGKSAWDYAVEGGYEGTEEEFAALMAAVAELVSEE